MANGPVENQFVRVSRQYMDHMPICMPNLTDIFGRVGIDCGGLRDPLYGRVDLDGTTLGSLATYSCNDGFVLEGDQMRKCQSDGQWSGREPVCKSKHTLCNYDAKINF